MTTDSKELLERAADLVVQRVSEYNDRTSPEDFPDALLITAEELRAELLRFAEDLPAASPADPKPAPDAMRDALDPFAKAAEMYNDIPGVVRTHGNVELWQQPNNIRGTRLTVDHLRAARAALSASEPVPPPAFHPASRSPSLP